MNAGIAIILFVSVAIIYMVIIDFCILIFRILGLTQEQARFQVISLLTNCGYTTAEAEIIVRVPSRRHMARYVMLFGNIFSVTIISLFVNAIITLPRYEAHEVLPFIIGTGIGFVAFILIRRRPKVRKYFDDKIILAAEKRLHGKDKNSVILLDEFIDASLSKVILNKVPKSLQNTPLSDLNLEDKGIYPLYYHSPNEPVKMVTDKTTLKPNISLTVVGPLKKVKEIFVDSLENEINKTEKAAGKNDDSASKKQSDATKSETLKISNEEEKNGHSINSDNEKNGDKITNENLKQQEKDKDDGKNK